MKLNKDEESNESITTW